MLENLSTGQVTAVIAVCAIVSPVITTLINVLNDLAMYLLADRSKRREARSSHEQEIFEQYLRQAGRRVVQADSKIGQYSESYYLALFHASEDLRPHIQKADDYLRADDRKHASDELVVIAALLHDTNDNRKRCHNKYRIRNQENPAGSSEYHIK